MEDLDSQIDCDRLIDAQIPSKYQTVLLSCFLFQDRFTHIAIKKVYYHTYFKWYSGADSFSLISAFTAVLSMQEKHRCK